MSLDQDLEDLVHDHVYLGAAHDENARKTLAVVLLTTIMMLAEIVAGLSFNSMALLADGVHMATHAGALGIAALAYAYAKKHAHSRRYSFGTGKVGDLAGFASALFLGLVSIGIVVESVQRLLNPAPVAFTEATLIAVLGLGVNLVSAWLLGADHHHGHGDDHHSRPYGHSHDHHHHDHHHHHDNNFRSAYVHVLADALTSVLAIFALLGGRYFGWVWLDPVMGMVGAVVIAAWSVSLLRDTASVLLDAHEPALEARVRAAVEGPGDARITDLHIWRVGPGAHAAIIAAKGVTAEQVRARLRDMSAIVHLTVEHQL
ncbi:MAG: CDF family Co(II)/Ni(II) efflux transporter DmeF [Chakrabartia sp.]